MGVSRIFIALHAFAAHDATPGVGVTLGGHAVLQKIFYIADSLADVAVQCELFSVPQNSLISREFAAIFPFWGCRWAFRVRKIPGKAAHLP